MSDDNEALINDSSTVTHNNGFGSMDAFGSDDDDAPFMEESPFANEPPVWLAADAMSKSAPAKTTSKPPALTLATASPRAGNGKEEAAPDNPYLHESRNLREEDGDFEIPLPKSLQGESGSLTEPGTHEEGNAEPQVIEAVIDESISQRHVEEAAPANPYLHESRNLREEDEDREIPLPKTLQDDPALVLQPKAQVEDDGKANKEDKGKESKPTKPVAGRQKGSNGHDSAGHNGNGHNGNGQNGNSVQIVNGKRTLQILFRPSGDVDRDKYRLQQIVETVRDPKGRDQFLIVIKSNGKNTTLSFPDDPCSISERLRNDLSKFFRVDVQVKE